jgi:hypothetical protein
MKKTLLLGTTALFAAAVVMGGAAQAAEEPITAGISGYFKSAIAAVSQDNADGEFADANLSTLMANSIEISVGGSATLDNGITYGFNAQIDAAGFDERHVFFSGSFGQIQAGQLEGARQQMTNFAPSVQTGGMGVNSPHFIFANAGIGGAGASVRTYTDGLGDEDNLKLVYFSPIFNGFRLGLSYAPDDAVSGAYGGGTTGGLGGLQNNAAAAAEFSNNFGDFSIRVSAGIETYTLQTCNVNAAGTGVVASRNTANVPATTAIIRTTADQNCNDNPTSVAFGAGVSFGDWSIGGGYLETEQIGNTGTGAGRDREDFDLGISYWSGPLGIALQYGQAELDDAAGLTDQLSIYQLQATYVVGPGFDVGAVLSKGEFDDATAGGLDNDYTTIAITTALSF